MAVPAVYNAGSLGPSTAASADTMAGQDAYALGMDRSQYNLDKSRLTTQFNDVTAPALSSSLGAAGQAYGTAGDKAIGQAQIGFQNQKTDLASAFNRAQMDMKRQEAYAA